MAASIKGVKTQVIAQWEENGTTDRFGVDILTRVEEIPKASFPASMRAKGSVHPTFTNMAVSKSSWTVGKGGTFYRVTYTYEGFLTTLPESVYMLSTSLAEEPIQLHPDFSTLAGSPSAPANGAIFVDPATGQPTKDDDLGVFREFKAIVGGEPNPKAGIEAYLSPGATWQEITFSPIRPGDLGSLGTIDEPSGSEPNFSGRNWIYSGAEYTKRGGVYEIRKTWLLSGRNGWDTDIY